MQHIKRVTSTLKGGCDVELGPRTVIFGPNGSGKSTIVQSIELATCGWVSDMEGRDKVKQSQSISRLFPEDVDMEVSCVTDQGDQFVWQMEKGARKGSYKKPVTVSSVSVSWPVQDMMAVLSGDAASVQAWLENKVFGSLSQEDALSKLPPSIRPSVEELMGRKKKADFLGLAKDARAEAKTLKANATRTERTIESMLEGVAPPLTESGRAQLEKKLARLSTRTNYVSQEDYDEKRAEIGQLAKDYEVLTNALARADNIDIDGKMAVIRKIQVALGLIGSHKDHLGSPSDRCWICGSAEAEGYEAKLTAALDQSEELVKFQAHQKKIVFAIKATKEKLEVEAETYKSMEVGSGEAYISAMNQLYADNASLIAWQNSESSRQEVNQLRAKADLLTTAAKSLSVVGKEALTQAKKGFEDRITSFLPEGESFGIELKSARVGLIRSGVFHSALSGAEWSRVMLAMSTALADSSTLNVLVPQDRAWDQGTLVRVMESLSESESQIILMSTVKPDPVKGWTLIDLTS